MEKISTTGWIAAGIGVATALLTAGGAYFSLEKERAALIEQQAKISTSQDDLERQQRAYEEQRAADLRAKQNEIALEQHKALCDQHSARITAQEDEFSALMNEHGLLLNALKSCMKSKPDDQASCALTVCAGAWFFSSGKSDCVSSATDAANIKSNIDRELSSAQSDSCPIPNSPAETFFNS